MNSDHQREAIKLLAEIWELSPDVRLGQLLSHLEFLGENFVERGLGVIEDDELIAIMQRHRGQLRARLEGLSIPEPGADADIAISGSPKRKAS